MGEGERGSIPFRYDPPLHRGVTPPPPPTLGGEGACGEGAEPGLESRGLSWARGPGGGLKDLGGACSSQRLGVCGGAGRGSARMGCAGMGSEVLRVHPHLWSVGRDGVGMAQGVKGCPGGPALESRGCVGAARGWGQRAETRALGMRAPGTGAASLSPLPLTHLGSCGLCTGEF